MRCKDRNFSELLLEYLDMDTIVVKPDRTNELIERVLLYILKPNNKAEHRDYIVQNLHNENFLTLSNICMAVKDYKRALEFLEKYKEESKIKTKLSGRTAKLKFFNYIENDFLVIEVDEENSVPKESFETVKLSFIDYKVHSLSIEAQFVLISELNYLIHTERDETLRREIIQCYIDRLKYRENSKDVSVMRYILYYESFISSKIYYEFSKTFDRCPTIDYRCIKSLPFINAYKFKHRLALVFMKEFLYTRALELFSSLHDYENIIRCYVGLGKEREAIIELKNRISRFEDKRASDDNVEFREVIDTQESYLLLASFLEDVSYYDKAFDLYQCAEPVRLKGLYYFGKGEFEKANEEFEKALNITRLERILFSYGCSLIKTERYREAVKVFMELTLYDPQNDKLYINMSNCYLNMNEYRKAALALEKAVKYNNNEVVTELFLDVCTRNNYDDLCNKFLERIKFNEDLHKKYKTRINGEAMPER